MAVFTIGSKTLSGSPTGGAVGGASNLTTVGAIPYVSASGVLNQDATALFWDATNHRLGVGTASPVSGYTQTIVAPDNSATTALYLLSNNLTQNLRLGWNGIFGSAAIDITTNGGIAAARFNTTGNLLLGGTTDGNYKLDVQKSGSTGTLRVYDQTATTGSTLAVIQAGAGQSGNLLSVRNNAGTEIAYVGNTGSVVGEAVYGKTIKNSPAGVAFAFHDGAYSTAGGYFQSTFPLVWNSDAGFKRSAAGYMAVTDGSTGLGKIVVSQTTPSASTDAGTAGAIWADATYIYVQTAAGTIKRVALTTF